MTECNDPGCTGDDETTTVVDGGGFVAGNDISITLSADGQPLIAYSDTHQQPRARRVRQPPRLEPRRLGCLSVSRRRGVGR